MRSDIFISRQAGRCPVCGCPILDSGYSDDPEEWEHDWACHVQDLPGVPGQVLRERLRRPVLHHDLCREHQAAPAPVLDVAPDDGGSAAGDRDDLIPVPDLHRDHHPPSFMN